jgi:hypothetical protein
MSRATVLARLWNVLKLEFNRFARLVAAHQLNRRDLMSPGFEARQVEQNEKPTADGPNRPAERSTKQHYCRNRFAFPIDKERDRAVSPSSTEELNLAWEFIRFRAYSQRWRLILT